jgi:hypothetical protein
VTLASKVAVLEELHRHALELVAGLVFSPELNPHAADVDRIANAIGAELTRAQAELADSERARQEGAAAAADPGPKT